MEIYNQIQIQIQIQIYIGKVLENLPYKIMGTIDQIISNMDGFLSMNLHVLIGVKIINLVIITVIAGGEKDSINPKDLKRQLMLLLAFLVLMFIIKTSTWEQVLSLIIGLILQKYIFNIYGLTSLEIKYRKEVFPKINNYKNINYIIHKIISEIIIRIKIIVLVFDRKDRIQKEDLIVFIFVIITTILFYKVVRGIIVANVLMELLGYGSLVEYIWGMVKKGIKLISLKPTLERLGIGKLIGGETPRGIINKPKPEGGKIEKIEKITKIPPKNNDNNKPSTIPRLNILNLPEKFNFEGEKEDHSVYNMHKKYRSPKNNQVLDLYETIREKKEYPNDWIKCFNSVDNQTFRLILVHFHGAEIHQELKTSVMLYKNPKNEDLEADVLKVKADKKDEAERAAEILKIQNKIDAHEREIKLFKKNFMELTKHPFLQRFLTDTTQKQKFEHLFNEIPIAVALKGLFPEEEIKVLPTLYQKDAPDGMMGNKRLQFKNGDNYYGMNKNMIEYLKGERYKEIENLIMQSGIGYFMIEKDKGTYIPRSNNLLLYLFFKNIDQIGYVNKEEEEILKPLIEELREKEQKMKTAINKEIQTNELKVQGEEIHSRRIKKVLLKEEDYEEKESNLKPSEIKGKKDEKNEEAEERMEKEVKEELAREEEHKNRIKGQEKDQVKRSKTGANEPD